MSRADAPPDYAIDFAIRAANASPCQKSRRGVAIFDPDMRAIRGGGHNYRPRTVLGGERSCDGSEACRRDCGRVCVHAEQYALRNMWEQRCNAFAAGDRFEIATLELVHVKVDDNSWPRRGGQLVAGKGPCCEQCSKLILDAGIAGVWLYEDVVTRHDPRTVFSTEWTDGRWFFYSAINFHMTTLQNLGLHGAQGI